MAQAIALMDVTTLELFGGSFHEPFHADGRGTPIAVTERSDLNRPQRRRDEEDMARRAVEQLLWNSFFVACCCALPS